MSIYNALTGSNVSFFCAMATVLSPCYAKAALRKPLIRTGYISHVQYRIECASSHVRSRPISAFLALLYGLCKADVTNACSASAPH